MDVLNVNEILANVTKKVERGSAVIVFDNVDDCANFADFLRVISFAYGADSPLDLSCVVVDEEDVLMSEKK